MDLLSLAIFGSFVWFCIIVFILRCTCFWSERAKHGGIAFAGFTIFLIINHFWGNVPVSNYLTVTNILIYLGIGLIYAIIRAYNYGTKNPTDEYKTAIGKLKGHVFRWWFIWPISLLSWLFTGLIKDFFDFLYRLFKGMFEYFFKFGQKHNKKEN